jgi:hypothetical protein
MYLCTPQLHCLRETHASLAATMLLSNEPA